MTAIFSPVFGWVPIANDCTRGKLPEDCRRQSVYRARGGAAVKRRNGPLSVNYRWTRIMTSLQSLLDSPTRVFWLLQTAGWTGFAGLHFLGGVGAGRPWRYIYASLSTAALGVV